MPAVFFFKSILTPPLLMQIPVRWLVAPALSAPGLQELSHVSFVPGREQCSSRNKHIHWWRKDKEALCLCTSVFHLRKSGTEGLQGGAGRSLDPVGNKKHFILKSSSNRRFKEEALLAYRGPLVAKKSCQIVRSWGTFSAKCRIVPNTSCIFQCLQRKSWHAGSQSGTTFFLPALTRQNHVMLSGLLLHAFQWRLCDHTHTHWQENYLRVCSHHRYWLQLVLPCISLKCRGTLSAT